MPGQARGDRTSRAAMLDCQLRGRTAHIECFEQAFVFFCRP